MKLRNIITKEICDAEMREDGIYIKANWSDEEKWFCYDLETLARGWEYYVEPKGPLIKDEKIRKAVRAWAEANEREYLLVIKSGGRLEVSDGSPHLIYISFHVDNNTLKSLDDRTYYPIDELCGEEEE